LCNRVIGGKVWPEGKGAAKDGREERWFDMASGREGWLVREEGNRGGVAPPIANDSLKGIGALKQ